jgi:hypothetical protein
MPTSAGRTASNARDLQEQFWALICSDARLLQDQFDAIIAAGWPVPPTHRPTCRTGTQRPAAEESARPPRRSASWAARPRQPGVDGWGRQRSPPDTAPQPATTQTHDRKGR